MKKAMRYFSKGTMELTEDYNNAELYTLEQAAQAVNNSELAASLWGFVPAITPDASGLWLVIAVETEV